jgi:hypothetical protein
VYLKVRCIKNLEIASVCSFACPYCPCKDQGEHREVGLMSEEVFSKSLEWLKFFIKQGTQAELNFFGVGESLLHPRFLEMLERTRDVMPLHVPLIMNTNGTHVTEELVREMARIGLDKIDITDHDALTTMKAIQVFKKVGIRWGYSRDAIVNPNNWGGLVKGWVEKEDHPRALCPWVSRGQVMIMSNGDVTRCCQDAFARGIICTVWDNLPEFDHTPFVQCLTCHEDIPQGMKLPEKKEKA